MPENIQNMKAEFELRFPRMVDVASTTTDVKLRSEKFTDVMSIARQFEMTDRVIEYANKACREHNLPPLWEMPVPFEREAKLVDFPVKCLPAFLPDYVQAMSESVQIAPEMIVLPLLSVLSSCVQGKAKIINPGGKNIEELNLYCLTVAPPGERKSSCNALLKPVWDYQRQYNEAHALEIKEHQTELRCAVSKKEKAIKSGKSDEAKAVDAEILQLEKKKIHPLQAVLADSTPESLVKALQLQDERIAVISDEAALFDALNYTSNPNINIILCSYDGTPYNSTRITRESTFLNNPLITISLMAQPSVIDDLMTNKQYVGRGLLQRFLFSFPAQRAGSRAFRTQPIPQELRRQYAELIERLMSVPYPQKVPIIMSDGEAASLFQDYFNSLESRMRDGEIFENQKEYFSKHFGKCLRIAGILHLIEHTPAEKISGQTAMNAINIAMWAESQALKAFGETSADTVEITNAKYILSKLKTCNTPYISKSALLGKCRKLNAERIEQPLQILEEKHYIKIDYVKNGSGRAKETIHINPALIKN